MIDEMVVKRIKDSLDSMGADYRLMVLPDHPTPIIKRTHTSDPVPFLIFDSGDTGEKEGQVFDEFYPQSSGNFIEEGHKLIDCFLCKKINGCKVK
jgi:2,3-bisphosphoglycerate-independent phosphoglycerate mutase